MKKLRLLVFSLIGLLLIPLLMGATVPWSTNGPCGGGNDANAMLLMHFNGATTTFTDSSSLAHTMAGDGTVSQETSVYKYGGSAVHFDGSGNQYVVNTEALPYTNFNFGSGDFTIDAWINLDASPTKYGVIAGHVTVPNPRSWSIAVPYGTALRFYYTTDGSTDINIAKSYTFTPGVWYHVALVRDGNTLRFFVNGQSIGTSDFTGVTIFPSFEGCYIGRFGSYASADDSFKGYVDELRVSNVARWTSNFIPYSCEYN